jgi:hypothetical protein
MMVLHDLDLELDGDVLARIELVISGLELTTLDGPNFD